MEQGQREKLTVARERAVLVACLLPGNTNDPHDPLGELERLADTAGAVVVDQIIQNRQKPTAATYIGSGKVQSLAEMVQVHEADVVIFDCDLSPSQIGNIEKATECKVIDRSELILDIFAARARTHESKLQVELAQLEYTYPRLRAMWSHLERIAGGAPTGIGTRGPGEQQLETDRRIVQHRRAELRRQIARIAGRKRREVDRRNRDFYTVGLVGYTNAGKSTLFNRVTDGSAYADDKLFATLSTRTRSWDLGDGDTVLLSDTVGFVRDLPPHLVASFKSTLEEATRSDMLVVVLDVSHPQAAAQLDTVRSVLDDIGAGEHPTLLLLNKIDLLEHNGDVLVMRQSYPDALPISAATGAGMGDVIARVRAALRGGVREIQLVLPHDAGKAIHFLESRTTVVERSYNDDHVAMTVRIGSHHLDQLRAMGVSVDPSVE
ncbi:MAG: GTPase HflX [Phycisphaeraceae bacterium]|nr:GTPase HflX [Phycisphaeraceae bacterium]